MSIRRRSWRSPNGETKEAWVVDYVDQGGARHHKTFKTKRDAETYHLRIAHEIRDGIHTPDSQSPTVAEAGELWFTACKAHGLERATLDTSYRIVLDRHIGPLIGATRLAALTLPTARAFEDRLRLDRSPAMVKKVMGIFSSILSDAQERGLVAQNVALSLRTNRRHRNKGDRDDRHSGQLVVGIDIPAPHEIRALVPCLRGRCRPLLLTAIFTGLRASELRGLRWADIDLKAGELHVRQRADRYRRIGSTKSKTSQRTVPLLPMVVNALREWKLACPKGDLDLAFPNKRGNVWDYVDIVERGWKPAQIVAGLVNDEGKAKYPGLHSLRHFFASWCINRKVDGGLELPLKVVQGRLGHATIVMTADRYGHLFPRGDDGAEMAAAEKALFV